MKYKRQLMESVFVFALIASGTAVSATSIDANNSKMGQYRNQVYMRSSSKDLTNEELESNAISRDKVSKKRSKKF